MSELYRLQRYGGLLLVAAILNALVFWRWDSGTTRILVLCLCIALGIAIRTVFMERPDAT